MVLGTGNQGALTIAATETGGDDGDLGAVGVWWPEGAVLEPEVVGAVEDDGVLGREGYRGHGWVRGSEKGEGDARG